MKTTAPKPPGKRFISQTEAAQRWDVSVDTIRRLISDGKVSAFRLDRIIRLDAAELDACFRPIPSARQDG